MNVAEAEAQHGKVYLVGAGPGDAELITVKGLRLIEEAEVLVYDALANPALLSFANPEAELIDAGKRAGTAKLTQDQTNALLAEKAKAGHKVVRLKGGDPYVFGRGSEEALYLHERGIDFEVVPGITSGIAGPAYAGIPVTHRAVSTSCTFITGHEDPTKDEPQVDYEALAHLARRGGTLCFYMGMKRLPGIAEKLIGCGLAPDTPAAVVQWGTCANQRSVTAPLATLHRRATEAGLGAPAIIVIGPVVGLDRAALNWFERRPLFGQTFLITRTRQQASHLRWHLEQLGGQVLEAPTIEIHEPDDWQPIIDAVTEIAEYDWLVLTSANGVIGLQAIMESLGMDGRDLASVKVAAIGQATADALEDLVGIRADLIPDEAVAESLVEAMRSVDELAQCRLLMLRADIARKALPTELAEAGADVTDLAIYRTRPVESLPDEVAEALRAGKVDWLTFTSSSTVRNFMDLLGAERRGLLDGLKVASIGPITSQAVREVGLAVTIEAADHDVEGLVAALQQAAAGAKSGVSAGSRTAGDVGGAEDLTA
jgi:uroporphyrinogen III methyltransferase/synthase